MSSAKGVFSCSIRGFVSVLILRTPRYLGLRALGVWLLRLRREWLDLYWRGIIRPDGSSVEKDHPSSINTGRTIRRTIGGSCDSSRVL